MDKLWTTYSFITEQVLKIQCTGSWKIISSNKKLLPGNDIDKVKELFR